MHTQADVIRMILVAFAVATLVLFATVVASKLRRDRAEQASTLLRARILGAWQEHDRAAMVATCRLVARGSIRQQSDFVMASALAAHAPWWDAERVASLRQASAESGLHARLLRQLRSRRAVRRGLAVAIGGYPGTALDTTAVAAMLRDPDPTVRIAAAAALEHQETAASARALIAALRSRTLTPPRLIERLGHRWAVPTMLDELNATDAATTAALVQALGLAGDAACIGPLLELWPRCEDEEVRVRIMGALAGCAHDAPLDARRLVEQFARTALADEHPVIRSAAARVLGEAGFADDTAVLARTMRDPDWFVRRAAARALAQLGEPGVDALRTVAVGDDDYAAQRAQEQLALAVLGAQGGTAP